MARDVTIPTLDELKAFEAVARLRSVSGASIEIGCSQPCISHRLRSLERRWSTDLFRRTTRSVEWTDDTVRAYERVRRILLEVEQLANEFDARGGGQQISITVSPSFASAWLISRLSSFHERHPAIEVKLAASNRFVDLTRENFDVGIRLMPHGETVAPGLVSVELAKERLIVVAGAAHAAQFGKGMQPAGLCHAKLLWQDGSGHWPGFFRHFLDDAAKAPHGPSFNNADLVIQAAVANQGVAIMRELLVADSIRKGDLVKIMEHSIDCCDSYFLVAPRQRFASRPVQSFRSWLAEQIDACHKQEPVPDRSVPACAGSD